MKRRKPGSHENVSHSASLGNGIRKNGVRNRCPYRRCGVDTEIPYRLPFWREFCLFLPVRVAPGVDTEFPYRVRIVDRRVDCRDPVADRKKDRRKRATSKTTKVVKTSFDNFQGHTRPKSSKFRKRKNVMSIKCLPAILGPEMAAPILCAPGILILSAGKPPCP